MGRHAELKEEFEEKYGQDWDRPDLTEEEEVEWIEACYELYDEEGELRDVYGGPYTDEFEKWYGHPFEIVEPIAPYTDGYDNCALPLYLIHITDMEDDPDDPGVFAAYPEELFLNA